MQWFRHLFTRRRRYDELSETIREHLDEKIADLIDGGMTREEAERSARRGFGNVTPIEERSREVWQWPTIESIWADVKFALRQLRRAAGFTVVCLLTLALGIGANTSVYSIIQAVILRPLPYPDPNRLVLLADPQDPQDGGILYKDFESWKQQSRSFTNVAVYYRDSGWSRVTLTGSEEPETVQGAFVSANFFPLLGVSPILGRAFTQEEELRHERVVVLSYGLWHHRFGGFPNIIGQNIRIDGDTAQVVGVMPADFEFPARDSEFWAPITTNHYWADPALNSNDGLHFRGFYARWQAIGRLKEDVSPQEAQAELNTIFGDLERGDPDQNRGSGINALPLRVQISGNTRLALYILFASVCLLLLIACINVANLVLARGLSRSSEMALRTALGASRSRIFQQLLTETAILAIFAGLFSLPVAFLSIRLLIAMGPPNIPRLQETGLNLGVLGFTFAVALLCAMICGLAPALGVWRRDPVEAMKSKGAATSDHGTTINTRSVLIVSEFALSVVLLTGAGLLIHSFLIVKAVDPGFEPAHVLMLDVSLSGGSSDWPSPLYDSVVARLRAVPGVKNAGAIDSLFDLGPTDNLGLRSVEGRAPEPRKQWTALTWDTVRGDYFQSIGTQLVRGRYFSDDDGPHSPLVAIIDESAARRYWSGENPIGKRFKGQDRRGQNDDWLTVIGVVRDIRTHGLEPKPTPHIYEWYRQSSNATPNIIVRVAGDPRELGATLRSAVRDIAPAAILSAITPVEQLLSQQLAPRRFQTSLLGLFSLLALTLASVGIYGVIHYSVVQRAREIGIRMALGAERSNIVVLILRQGLLLACIGLSVGLALDWAATRLLSKLLYDVSPSDPITLAGVSLLLISVALLASFVPALRAARVDPIQALRSE